MNFLRFLRYNPLIGKRAPSFRNVTFNASQREALFESTERWLWNDNEQRAARRVDFDPDALQRIACEALDANECITFTPMPEGSYNRTYRLSFDNGEEATLKIPFRLPGHTSRRTASEVATLQYMNDTSPIPAPSVIAWSSRKDATPVGSEFILLEYVPGETLANHWHDPDFDPLDVFRPLLRYERAFQEASFSGIGSLCFKDDVLTECQQPLFASVPPPSYEAVKDKYRVGPLADRQYWRGQRGDKIYDHGPCELVQLPFAVAPTANLLATSGPTMLAFFTAIAKNQLLFLEKHAKDDAPFRRPPFHSRDTHRAIIETYLETIPHVLPLDDAQTSLIWHPDLNAHNILIKPKGRRSIVGIIDWQDTAIMPFLMQSSLPPLVIADDDEFGFKPKDLIRQPDPFPENPAAHGISANDEPRARVQHERIRRMMWYIGELLDQERRSPVLPAPCGGTIAMLPLYIVRSWEDGIIPVRKALYTIHDSWDDLAQHGVSRPAALVDLCCNRAVDEVETKRWDFWISQSEQALGCIACEGDGLVDKELASEALEAAPNLKEEWDKENLPGPYPFVDGQYSYFLS
ncbi:hypothetical protein HGRIS_013897 [Hohenbuehelia grisea]|uniref:Altered inheritance of mitochondria protein 9, mitochondrial n=1 Tax=Hohenbuehelia grisea TaxID=104357 RepID=A0ABR3IX54_9AGAR